MSTHFNFMKSSRVPHAQVLNLQGDVSHRAGNMRAITLDNRAINMNRIFGARKITQELIETPYEKISLEAQLDNDVSAYQIKNIF